MITLFTGSPGAGKTASLVDFLSKLQGDRPLYVDGLEGLTLPHTPVDANEWPTALPDGAILVVDEAQRVWRPRGSGAKVPESVAAMETHRHRGIDIYMTTQAPALIDSNVRNLVGRHVHIRDTGIMGRWWYEWPEVSVGMVWKTCINKKRYKLPKKAFALYKSSSLHVAPVRGVPRLLIVVILLVLASIALVYGAISALSKRIKPKDSPVVVSAPGAVPGAAPGLPGQPVKPRLDDRVDWIPRVSNRPESAPAYDHLRVVVSMPVVTGAICINDACRCLTAQGTNAGLTSDECRAWAKDRPFNPYVAESPASPASAPAYPSAPGVSGA